MLWLLTVPVLILAILLDGAWPAWRTALASNGQQGRYLYPGLVALLILFAVGLRALAGRRSVLIAAIAVGITQLMMAAALVWTYWLPRGRPVTFGLFADAWHAMVAWSALNGPALAVLILVVVALFGLVVWEAARFKPGDTDDHRFGARLGFAGARNVGGRRRLTSRGPLPPGCAGRRSRAITRSDKLRFWRRSAAG